MNDGCHRKMYGGSMRIALVVLAAALAGCTNPNIKPGTIDGIMGREVQRMEREARVRP